MPAPGRAKPVTGREANGARFDSRRSGLLIVLLFAAMAACSPLRAQSIAADTAHPDATRPRQLQLNHGQLWPTDVALREGMRRIRAVALWIQSTQVDGPLSTRQARAAAASIEDSVAAIVEHPPRGAGVDANLHILLARVLAADGLAQLLDALELYPRYFDDPEWQPVEHDPPFGH